MILASYVASPRSFLMAAAIATMALLAVPATAQPANDEACISAKTKARLTTCPPGRTPKANAPKLARLWLTTKSKPTARRSPSTDDPSFARTPMSQDDLALLATLDGYLCAAPRPPPTKKAALERAEVKYVRARVYYQARHWENAAAGFRDLAIGHPDQETAIHSALLYVETLNILTHKTARPNAACGDTLTADLPQLINNFCVGKKADANPEQCGLLLRLRRDIDRARIPSAPHDCAEQPTQCLANYEAAADGYRDLFRAHYIGPCRAERTGCKGAEEVLYNAATAYRNARMSGRMVAIKRLLVDPQYHLHETEIGLTSLAELGADYEAIGFYTRAANWYEEFAIKLPKADTAQSAMARAMTLRLALGDSERADKDYQTSQRFWGRRQPKEVGILALALANSHARRGEWKRVEAILGRTLRHAFVKIDSINLTLRVHALLARSYDRQGKDREAANLYDKIRRSRVDPKRNRLPQALDAVSEATSYFGLQKQHLADAIRAPVYRGPRDKSSVNKFVMTKVKPWLTAKRQAIVETEKEYAKLLEIKPAPAPRWTIAASLAIGGMWTRLRADVLASPYPKQWDQPGPSSLGTSEKPLLWAAIRAQYQKGLEDSTAPYLHKARGAYLTGWRLATKHRIADKNSRACERWLERNFPREFPPIREYRGLARRINRPLGERSQFLHRKGAAVVVGK